MTKRISSELLAAVRKRLLIRFSRPFEPGWVKGYVVSVGPKFFAVAFVSDEIWFEGFQCFRISDVRELRADKFSSFVETALKKRGERMPRFSGVSVGSIEELLVSANRKFPLVTIHREKVDPDVCWIGQVIEIAKGRVSFLEISPDATWERESSSYKLSEITRVDFGGDYENALHLVGGPPAK